MTLITEQHTFFFARRSPSRGFTLIEILAVLFIMLTMLLVVLANYPQFSEQKSLELFAQDIAQTAREAQIYSLSGREISANQFVDFGIYYTEAVVGDRIVFFADLNQNGAYDLSPNDVVVRDIPVVSPLSIQKVTDDTMQEITEFTALFRRPDLEPVILARRVDSPTAVEVGYVRITFAGPSGTKAVEIWSSGQIAVK